MRQVQTVGNCAVVTSCCHEVASLSRAPLLPTRDGLVLIVNPQWRTEGNVVSDLGILPWVRKANEELVGSFQEVRVVVVVMVVCVCVGWVGGDWGPKPQRSGQWALCPPSRLTSCRVGLALRR